MAFPNSRPPAPGSPELPKGFPDDAELMGGELPDDDGPEAGLREPPPPEDVDPERMPGSLDQSLLHGTKGDPLTPSRERIARLMSAMSSSKLSRKQFNDEFAALTAVTMVRNRIEAKGIPASDPISIFIEICGILDLRQRDCIVSLAALLELNENVTKTFVSLMEDYVVEVQASRDASEDARALTGEVLETAHLLLVHLDHAAKVYPALFNRVEHLFTVMNQRSGLNVVLTWLTPILMIFLTWLACRLMYGR